MASAKWRLFCVGLIVLITPVGQMTSFTMSNEISRILAALTVVNARKIHKQ